jgi:hypothetical protein
MNGMDNFSSPRRTDTNAEHAESKKNFTPAALALFAALTANSPAAAQEHAQGFEPDLPATTQLMDAQALGDLIGDIETRLQSKDVQDVIVATGREKLNPLIDDAIKDLTRFKKRLNGGESGS